MTPHEIIEFQKWLKDQEEAVLDTTENVVAKMWIKGVFSILQTELEIKLLDESEEMATHYGEKNA